MAATRSCSVKPAHLYHVDLGGSCGITRSGPTSMLAAQAITQQGGVHDNHPGYHVSCQTFALRQTYTGWMRSTSSHTGQGIRVGSWGYHRVPNHLVGSRCQQDPLASVQCCAGRAIIPERTLAASSIRPILEDGKHLDPQLTSRDSAFGSEQGMAASSSTTTKIVRILLIDNYDSYTYNLYQLLAVINGAPPVTIFNDQMSWDELKPLLVGPARAFDNVVISPGPGTPARAEDIGVCPRLFTECPDLPVLGVCLGHQLLAHVHGAVVTHAPEPVHGRLSELEHSGHRLFQGIPSGDAAFKVVRYHSLAVDPRTLPPHLVPTAWTIPGAEPSTGSAAEASASSRDDRHSICHGNGMGLPSSNVPAGAVLMGLSHRHLPHHGVQYHPESVATAYGERLLRNFHAMTVEHWQRMRSSGRAGLVNGHHANWSHMLRKDDAHTTERIPSPMDTFDGQVGDEQPSAAPKPSRRSEAHYRVAWTKLDAVLHDGCGSEEVFMALYGQEGGQDAFWLDSSSIEEGRGRFSFLGGKGGRLWHKVTYGLDGVAGRGGHVRVEDAGGHVTEERIVSSIFEYLEEELALRRCPNSDTAALPFDFCGGFVGYLGYELKRECGAAANRHVSQLPDAAFFLVDHLVVIDHAENDVYILELLEGPKEEREGAATSGTGRIEGEATSPSSAEYGEPNRKDAEGEVLGRVESTEWIEQTATHIRSLCTADSAAPMLSTPFPQEWEQRGRGAPFCPEDKAGIVEATEYVEAVDACMEEIRNGESYEVCLTTRLHPPAPVPSPLALYRHLRHANPAPYSAWMAFGEGGPAVVCCSPERFLKLDRHGTLEAKPIKGTSRRSADPEEDARLREALRMSPKEWAENLMIVDLLRNDLGKVCQVGSVHVPRLMAVESFATVHQLVSTVRGKKREDLGPLACVRAAFPGGSMTGAPKVRTMAIIDAIERSPRGVYSGALGFFSVNGTFDLNVVIRTATWQKGHVSIGAGGAVVALSDPEAEYAEMLLKAQALLTAVAETSTAGGAGQAR